MPLREPEVFGGDELREGGRERCGERRVRTVVALCCGVFVQKRLQSLQACWLATSNCELNSMHSSAPPAADFPKGINKLQPTCWERTSGREQLLGGVDPLAAAQPLPGPTYNQNDAGERGLRSFRRRSVLPTRRKTWA